MNRIILTYLMHMFTWHLSLSQGYGFYLTQGDCCTKQSNYLVFNQTETIYFDFTTKPDSVEFFLNGSERLFFDNYKYVFVPKILGKHLFTAIVYHQNRIDTVNTIYTCIDRPLISVRLDLEMFNGIIKTYVVKFVDSLTREDLTYKFRICSVGLKFFNPNGEMILETFYGPRIDVQKISNATGVIIKAGFKLLVTYIVVVDKEFNRQFLFTEPVDIIIE